MINEELGKVKLNKLEEINEDQKNSTMISFETAKKLKMNSFIS